MKKRFPAAWRKMNSFQSNQHKCQRRGWFMAWSCDWAARQTHAVHSWSVSFKNVRIHDLKNDLQFGFLPAGWGDFPGYTGG